MNNLIEVRKDIPSGTILIRNPDRRNALSTFGLIQLRQALEDLHQEKGVRAVIITGDQNIFCSGTRYGEILYLITKIPMCLWVVLVKTILDLQIICSRSQNETV